MKAWLRKMPYPSKYVRNLTLRGGTEVLIRPIKPDDVDSEREFIQGLSEESSFYRFFAVQREMPPEVIEAFCNIDYEKQMALVAETRRGQRKFFAGVGRIVESTQNRAELAVVVGDEFQGKGLGAQLTSVLLEFARDRKFSSIYALILPENTPMINLARKFGFKFVRVEDKVVIVELPLAG